MPGSRLRELKRDPVPPAPGGQKSARLSEQLGLLDNRLWWGNHLNYFGWDFDRGGFPYGGYGHGYPADRAQDKSHAPLPYLTEVEYFRHVTLARDLLATNDLAIGYMSRVRQYVGTVRVSFVLAGQAPGPGSAGPADADGDGVPDVAPLVADCHRMWEEFRRKNDWGRGAQNREKEAVTRATREGDVTVRLFKGAPGEVPALRFVEPEFVRTPPGASVHDPEYMGVITPRGDAEEYTGVCVQNDPDDPTDVTEVPRGRVVRLKRNADRCCKRGLSDFLPSTETLRKAGELIDNMGITAAIQSKYPWIEKMGPGIDPAALRRVIEAGVDHQATKYGPNGPKLVDVEHVIPGTVKRVENGREFLPGPTATPGGFLEIVEASLRRVSIRFGFPDQFVWGKGDSFAAVLVTNSPFVHEITERQEEFQGFVEELVEAVLALCEESGRLPRGTGRRVRAVCTSPAVTIADEQKQWAVFEGELKAGVASPYDYMRERERVPERVLADCADFAKKKAENGIGAPPDGNPPAPPGRLEPAPAPPGSAGGDGSSPNDDPFGAVFGESLLAEGFTGTITDKLGHKRHYVDGKQVAGTSQPSSGDVKKKADVDPARDHAAAEHYLANTPERPQPKHVAAARKYADVARRRRVIHAVKNEGELAQAIGGHNLPDSEPADVVHIVDASGKVLTDHDQVRAALRQREEAVTALKSGKLPSGGDLSDEARQAYEARLALPAHFFEVKTLLTSRTSAVHMSKDAMRRKERWIDRYGVSFSVVAFDDRKGQKHSGNRVYIAAHELGGTTRLENMKRVELADVLAKVRESRVREGFDPNEKRDAGGKWTAGGGGGAGDTANLDSGKSGGETGFMGQRKPKRQAKSKLPVDREAASEFRETGSAGAFRIHDANKPLPKRSANMWSDADDETMPGVSGYANFVNALDDMIFGTSESATGENYTKNVDADGGDPHIVVLAGDYEDGPGAEVIVPKPRVAAVFSRDDVLAAFRTVAKEIASENSELGLSPTDVDRIPPDEIKYQWRRAGYKIDSTDLDRIADALRQQIK